MLDLLASADVCSLFLLAIVLALVGNAVSAQHRQAQMWSVRAGIAVFLMSLGFWIIRFGLSDAEFFTGCLIQAAVFGGIAYGAVGTAVPTLHWGYRLIVEEPRELLRQRAARRRSEREQEELHRLLESRQEEERRQRRQEEERKVETRTEQQHEQSIRQDARFEVRAYYDAHPEIAGKLPPERLERYLAEDLADAHPAEKVRERAEKLIGMMKEMAGGRTTTRWESEDEIVAHFTAAMQRYGEAGCYSQAEVETLQSEVRMQMHRALEEFRRGGA